jgi:hypothetical protein
MFSEDYQETLDINEYLFIKILPTHFPKVDDDVIYGIRYDDKTLYSHYRTSQKEFEIQGSKVILNIGFLVKKMYNIIEILEYCSIVRNTIDITTGIWRRGTIETPMQSGNREFERKKICDSEKSNDEMVRVDEYTLEIKSRYPELLRCENLEELQKKFKLIELKQDTDIVERVNSIESPLIIGYLTCIMSTYSDDGPSIEYYLFLELLYEECLEVSEIESKIKSIAKLHYYLCVKTPFSRGGGSIAEWIAGGLMLYFDIPYIGWKVEVWNKAVTRGVSQFVEEYPDYVISK